MALTMGFLLGLTRKRPMAGQLKRSAHTGTQAETERMRERTA
jgi:hypothetical protein